MNVTRIRLDRIASATRNIDLAREVTIGSDVVVQQGYVLAVRILNDKYVYNTMEHVTGRMIPLHSGDIMAGVLGSRRALQGYAGIVPEQLSVGETINILNLGGVLGKCTGANPELGPPFEAEVLGAILSFPQIGDRVGVPAHIGEGAVETANEIGPTPPVVYVAGTSMNSGKTMAATEITRFLVKKGLKVAACKMTGVSLRRDTLRMLDAGAVQGVDFTDLGKATTHNEDVLPVARGLLNHLSKDDPDLIVAELGDGILGEYGVDAILSDPQLMKLACCHVVCASDPVAIFGADEIYRQKFGLNIHVVAGPVTDNSVGRDYIASALGLPACNARYDIEGLGNIILKHYENQRAL
jgi:hypothetical protein